MQGSVMIVRALVCRIRVNEPTSDRPMVELEYLSAQGQLVLSNAPQHEWTLERLDAQVFEWGDADSLATELGGCHAVTISLEHEQALLFARGLAPARNRTEEPDTREFTAVKNQPEELETPTPRKPGAQTAKNRRRGVSPQQRGAAWTRRPAVTADECFARNEREHLA